MSTSGQLFQQMLRAEQGFPASVQMDASVWGAGINGSGNPDGTECDKRPQRFVSTWYWIGPCVYQPGLQDPAVWGGAGRGSIAQWAGGPEHDRLWRHFDEMSARYGAHRILWVIADHRHQQSTRSDVDAVYQKIRRRAPSAPITILSAGAIIPDGVCSIFGAPEAATSDALAAYAVSRGYGAAFPGTLTKAPPQAFRDCHFTESATDAAVQGKEMLRLLSPS